MVRVQRPAVLLCETRAQYLILIGFLRRARVMLNGFGDQISGLIIGYDTQS